MAASQITLILREFSSGDKTALDRLMPLVYGELRKLADSYLQRERTGHTLQPTALVHEAYLRMVDQNQPDYRSRAHFMGIAAHLMRQILTDHARTRNAAKRGSGIKNVSLAEVLEAPLSTPPAMVAVADALEALESQDAQLARLIELRFFGGLTAEESAEVTGLTVAQVRADLRVAQAWLQRELDRGATA